MPDVVVTVPKDFWYAGLEGIAGWIAEGDAAGEPWSGTEWLFTLGGSSPKISKGERVYVVHNNKLRGYAPLIRVDTFEDEDDLAGWFGDLEDCPPRRRVGGCALVRGGGAVAVTIDEPIRGFQGFRYRWWEREAERPFPEWQTP
jgi:hypothetical protein